MKRKWKVEQDNTNSLTIFDDQDMKMCEFVSEEDECTPEEKARMQWICDACNAYKEAPPEK